MKRRRRQSVRTSNTPVELLEDRQLLTGVDFGDATLLGDQGLIPGPELNDLRITGDGVSVYPAFSPDQLRYGVTPSAETDGLTIKPFAQAGHLVSVNGRSVAPGDSIVLRDLGGGETVEINVTNPTEANPALRTRRYEIMNLPLDFPLDVKLNSAPDVNPGSIYVTPRPRTGPNYFARIDHNGVPDFVQTVYPNQGQGRGPSLKLGDFKRHPNGKYSYADGYRRNEFNRFDYEIVVGTLAQTDKGIRFFEEARLTTQGPHMNHTDFHDFLILDNGDYALISYNGIERDGILYEDSILQVLDPVTLEEKFLWNSWDEIGKNLGTPQDEVVGGVDRIPEYAHINSIFQDDNGDFIMSLRFTSSIVKISGTTGKIIWRLGGLRNDFDIDDPWAGPCGQHTAQINSKGNLIYYDNGTPCPDLPEYEGRPEGDDRRMRYVEYELDEENMTAKLVREIIHPTYRVGPTGSVQELPNDHVLVSWGLPGQNFSEYSLIEYDANDEPVREYSFDGAGTMHFSYRAWYAQDANYPTLAADNGASHTIANDLFLGSGVDADTDGQPSTTSGDDVDVYFDDEGNLVNDEDGVTFVTDLVPGTMAEVDVTASKAGVLNAWIDFNRDGDWDDAGEQIFADMTLSAGANSLAFGVPSDALQTTTFSRFRFSSETGLSPVGHASDGEVEDHSVSIVSTAPSLIVTPEGRTGDVFGREVAVSGRYAAVAAPHAGSKRAGAVFIYKRENDNSDTWTQVTRINAPDEANDFKGGDRFGWSIALQGNTLVVGAPREEDGEADKTSGAAYVFERDAGGTDNWGLVQRLRAADLAVGDQFGSSVGFDDETIVVGARLDDGPVRKNAGSIYVFKRKANNFWQQERHLWDPAAQRNDHFGFSVDVEGNNIIVGAPNADIIEETEEGNVLHKGAGRAYVYHRTGSNWDLLKKMGAPDLHNDVSGGDRFGRSVAIDKSIAVVGAYSEEAGESDLSSGAAYVLRKNAGGKDTWGVARKLTASDPSIRDQFGYDVDVHEGRVAVGARTKRTDSGILKAGTVFLFDRFGDQDNWREIQKFQAPDAAPRDNFGTGVAVTKDYTLVGAPLADDSGDKSGKVYSFFTATTDPLMATGVSQTVVERNLTTAELQPVVDAAVEQWRQQPLTNSQLTALDNFSVAIGNLSAGRLGQTTGHRIVIDDNAAGFGWHVDSTLSDIAEGRMDLLSTVSHEIGHVLGHEHGHALSPELAPGERHSVGEAEHAHDVDEVFSLPRLGFDLL